IIRNAQIIGALAGYIFSGGDGQNVSIAGTVASSAVKHNYLTHLQLEAALANRKRLEECSRLTDACSAREVSERIELEAFFADLSAKNTNELIAACGSGGDQQVCSAKIRDLAQFYQELENAKLSGLDPYFSAHGFSVKESVFNYDQILAEYLVPVQNGTFAQQNQAITDAIEDLAKGKGGVSALLDTLGVVGGAAVCASGVGTAACVAGIIGASASANSLTASGYQAATGKTTTTALVKGLNRLGVNEKDAVLYEYYVNIGV